MTATANTTSQSTGQPMRLLSFQDVRDRIQGKLQQGQPGTTTAAAWAKLDEIVGDRITGSGPHDADLQQIWRINRIEVSRFRGTSPRPDEPLILTLPDCAGITVFHGVNGSGKSTIADALHAVLHPEYDPGTLSTKAKVNDDPWDAFDIHVDAEDAEVRATLRSDAGEEMQFVTAIDSSGYIQRSMQRGTDGTTTASGRAPQWDGAFAIHRPVFSYAREHRNIRRGADLHAFLLGHLLIGGCLDAIRDKEVAPHLTAARVAQRDSDSARQTFDTKLTEIAERYPESPDHRVAAPTPSQSKQDWLEANMLAGTHAAQAAPQVTAEQISLAKVAVQKAHAAIEAYCDTASASWGPLLPSLERLARHAAVCESLPADECPVCASQVDWRTGLAGRLHALEHLAAPKQRAEDALVELRDDHTECLRALAALLAMQDPDRPHRDWAPTVRKALSALDEVFAGDPHDQAVYAAAAGLRGIVKDERFDDLAHRLAEHAHSLQEWNRARRQAAHEFAEVWWENRDVAATLKLWKAVEANLRSLGGEIRAEREDDLLRLLTTASERLLGDAGLTPAELAIAAKTAAPTFRPGVEGQAARPLGVLSAGQHNAFLLAPVIGPRSPRPFGFAVFDDPVHALDDLRIDALATYLRERAETHQVIVFTHDERLTEILRHSTVGGRFFTVQRDPVTSIITATPDKLLWARLLDACRDALNPAEPATAARPGVARRLMRQAVDSALRDALLKHLATTPGVDTTAHLSRFNEAKTTALRFSHLHGTYPATPLAAAIGAARTHVTDDVLNRWNRASHRDAAVPIGEVRAERKLAHKACQILSPDIKTAS